MRLFTCSHVKSGPPYFSTGQPELVSLGPLRVNYI
jgi:hypothetical protein